MLKIFYCSKQWTIVLPIVLSKNLSLSMLIDVMLMKKGVYRIEDCTVFYKNHQAQKLETSTAIHKNTKILYRFKHFRLRTF